MAAVRTFIVKSSTSYPITFPEKILSFLAIPCRKSYNDLSRLRRIFAWIGIVVLVGLYVTTLILAFSGSPMAQALFRGSFAATVVFPVLLYAMQIIYRILKPDDTVDDPDKKKR